MSRPVEIDVGGRAIAAFTGDCLLDALILGGLELPGDCRSGTCRLCPLHVIAGKISGGEAGDGGRVKACRCTVESDLVVALPPPESLPATGIPARVAAIVDLTPGVVELMIEPAVPFRWLPGQYVHVTFAGFPARAFCPTVALDGADRPGSFRLHVARNPGGAVSGAIGRDIRVGHPVALEGPFGQAGLLPGGAARLMLFSGGTGFAPLWAIADQALRENAARRLVVVAGAPRLEDLYMAQALERMSLCTNVAIVPVTEAPQTLTPIIRQGSPADFAGQMTAGDIVYAAGPPPLVQAVGWHAAAAGAQFRASPFSPPTTADDRWLAQAARRFAGPSHPPGGQSAHCGAPFAEAYASPGSSVAGHGGAPRQWARSTS